MPSAVTAEPPPDFAGLVLAGGASSRMGRDKAELDWGGRSLLAVAVQRLAETGADPVLVSGDRPDWDCVPDRHPGLGPLGGLVSVLEQRPGLMGRLLLITPVDVPGLSAESLRTLARAATREQRGCHFHGHPLPLAVPVTDHLLAQLQAMLADGGKASVHRLAEALGFSTLPPTGHDLSNVNTPDDWQRFREASA